MNKINLCSVVGATGDLNAFKAIAISQEILMGPDKKTLVEVCYKKNMFEIVDAILGGVYNRYQGHRNTENKPIIKWHGYSSYPINYQKVWLNKLAMGEQLDP